MPLHHFTRRVIRLHPCRVRCSAYAASQRVALHCVDARDNWLADQIAHVIREQIAHVIREQMTKGEITDVHITMFCVDDDAE